MNPATGEIIDGKYRIVRMLGQGGMGAVYEGENLRIRRRVAIKLLHATVSSQAESVARFEREAQAAAQIGSDHICEVLDLGVLQDGTRYMVMEYLEGETLGARIERLGRLGPELSVPIMIQVLEALGAAHAAGIIHRDLKPDNIFILPTKSGIPNFVKVLDFGVSKFSQLGGEQMSMTRTGAVVGTPYYMSPEQARGSTAIDARTDIYAMGVLLYQATTGQVPFDATTFNELLFKIVLEPAPPVQQFVPDVDPELANIIQKAMAREPGSRYPTCAEYKNALVNWLAARPGLSASSNMRGSVKSLLPLQPIDTGTATQRLSGSGSSWANPMGSSVSGITAVPQPQTSNAWAGSSSVGNASQPPRPASKAPIIVAAAGLVTVVGVIAGGWLVFGRKAPPPVAPATADASAAVAPTPTPAATLSRPKTEEPTVTTAAKEPDPPPSTAKSSAPVAPSAALPAPPHAPLQRPPSTPVKGAPWPPPKAPTTATPATKQPKSQVPGDFGY